MDKAIETVALCEAFGVKAYAYRVDVSDQVAVAELAARVRIDVGILIYL